MSFVFYDVETTGKDKRFDQILQFAAICTDTEFNEIARIEKRCRLLPHLVPSPGALMVTNISIDQIVDATLPSHYEMVCEIATTLASWGAAVYIGWNTIDFDEHLMRQALYQCLHLPYLTNTNGNGRCDALKIAQTLHALQPEALVVPYKDDGKPVFKLDRIAPVNGFDHSKAHDAMADVEATVHICRIIEQRAPDHWSNALRFPRKAAAISFMEDTPAFLATECYFGRVYHYALTMLPFDGPAPSSVLTYDLAVDPAELRILDDAALARRLGRKVKPIRRIRANAAPLLHDAHDFDDFQGWSPDMLNARAEDVRSDVEFCARLVSAAERETAEVSPYVEDRIYDDHSQDPDRNRMAAFHAASDWTTRVTIARGFDDLRLRELGARLAFHHAPHALNDEDRADMGRSLAMRMLGHGFESTPWLTLPAADAEAVELLVDCSDEHRLILLGLREYIAKETARCAHVVAEG